MKPKKKLDLKLIDELFDRFSAIWDRQWTDRIVEFLDAARQEWAEALGEFEWEAIQEALGEARNELEYSPSPAKFRALCAKHRRSNGHITNAPIPCIPQGSVADLVARRAKIMAQLKKLHYPTKSWDKELSNEIIQIFNLSKNVFVDQNKNLDEFAILNLIENEVEQDLRNQKTISEKKFNEN